MAARLHAAAEEADRCAVRARELLRGDHGHRGGAGRGNPVAAHHGHRRAALQVREHDQTAERLPAVWYRGYLANPLHAGEALGAHHARLGLEHVAGPQGQHRFRRRLSRAARLRSKNRGDGVAQAGQRYIGACDVGFRQVKEGVVHGRKLNYRLDGVQAGPPLWGVRSRPARMSANGPISDVLEGRFFPT